MDDRDEGEEWTEEMCRGLGGAQEEGEPAFVLSEEGILVVKGGDRARFIYRHT